MGFTSINDSQARAQQPRSPEEQAARTYLNPPEMVNHLLLVWPIRYEANTVTKYPRLDGKPSDACYVDVVDLSVPGDDGYPGKVMRQAKWTQGRLIRDTKGAIGIGRDDAMLVQMTKDGDAYQLIEQAHNPGSVQMAEWWLTAHPHFQPGQDAPQPQSPAPQYAPASNGAVPGHYEATHAAVPGGWPTMPATTVVPGQVTLQDVMPGASVAEHVPAAPIHTPAQNATLERLRAQAARPNPIVGTPGAPPLPPPPPMAPPSMQDDEPPF